MIKKIINTNRYSLLLAVYFIFSIVSIPAYSSASSLINRDGNVFSQFASNLPACSTDQSPGAGTGGTKCQDPAIKCSANNCDLIKLYLAPAINVFSSAFALIAVISLILGGINYTTSEGDPQKVSRAKLRIRNTVFAVVSYMLLYAFLQFLIPGGLFRK